MPKRKEVSTEVAPPPRRSARTKRVNYAAVQEDLIEEEPTAERRVQPVSVEHPTRTVVNVTEQLNAPVPVPATTPASTPTVYLKCISVGSRLRVRIVTPGYFQDANCQFPRSIRTEGKFYSAPASCVRLVESSNGNYFYSVTASQVSVLNTEPTLQEIMQGIPTGEIPSTTQIRKGKQFKQLSPDLSDFKIFMDTTEDPDCSICFDSPKSHALVPCGHFCLCIKCAQSLIDSQPKCPICRSHIQSFVDASKIR